MGRLATASKNQRHQPPSASSIIGVIIAEGMSQNLLLQPGLAQISHKQDYQSQQRVILAGSNGGSQRHAQHCGVDRMSQKAVGSSANQLVVDADSDLGGPVAAQVPPRPDCQHKESGLNDGAHGYKEVPALRQKPAFESWRRPEKQHQSQIQDELMEHG